MVPSHTELGFAEVAALFPGDGIFGMSLLATMETAKDKVMAGGTPANLATLVSWVRAWLSLSGPGTLRRPEGVTPAAGRPAIDWGL